MPHPFRIEETVEIEATPEEVWDALTIGQQLDGWWIGAPNEVEPRLGGKVRQSFGGEVSKSTITGLDPASLRRRGHARARRGGARAGVHRSRAVPAPDRSFVHSGFLATTGSTGTRRSPRATR